MTDPDAARGDPLVPHPSRLDPGDPASAAILEAHQAAVADGSPTYLDPATGFVVFTAAAHLARGSCCDSGCRHCPFVGR